MNDAKVDAKSIFLDALDCPGPEELRHFLDQACGSDVTLRARVEELIRAHRDAGAFLGKLEGQDVIRGQSDALSHGAMVGPYKLLEQIGEGGMGLVYVAEQQQPVKRRVALKIIKPGMDSRQVIARFEAERQALAMMDHPNIAKIHDGGTTSGESGGVGAGRPYFVMELVKGKPITEYADLHRLTTRQRLELFLDVCHAVQHAHLKGIIHRDLKPSNVLVSLQGVRPVVKIIDFGVAKATGERLTDQSIYTCFAQMIGTPLYMSPEQAGLSDSDVDTRSDVYSLGVLLYELLTGTTPFESATLKQANFDELRRIIREDEPPRPSQRLTTMEQASLSTICECRSAEPRKLSQQVRGDLDWVVMKALEKDRDRRYESASALAADVQRYLNEDAVEACPPSAGYRLRKYVRRNRRLLVPVAVIGTVLVAATAVSTWQALRARDAESRAVTDAAIARAVNEFFQVDLLGQAHRDSLLREELVINKDFSVKEALDQAAVKVGSRFQDQPLVEAAIRSAIGEAYHTMGVWQLAVPHLERAIALRQGQPDQDQANNLKNMINLADSYMYLDRYEDGIALRKLTLENRKSALGPNHPETLECERWLAQAYHRAGHWAIATPLLEQLLVKQQTICGPTHASTLATMHHLAMSYQSVDRFAESMDLHEKVLEYTKSTTDSNLNPPTWILQTYARACQGAGKLDRADELLREALEHTSKREPSVQQRLQKANTLGWLALNLVMQHRYADAEPLAREAAALYERDFSNRPRRFYWLSVLGAAFLGQQKHSEAEQFLLQGYEGLKQRETMLTGQERLLAEAGERIVRFYEITNEPEKAREWRERLRATHGQK
jgi:eukaryotic-like serine/threonine-protein kinase